MKALLTGATGQLGHALRQRAPEGVELIATSRSGDGGGLLPLDLADAGACRAADPGRQGRPVAAGEHRLSLCSTASRAAPTAPSALGLAPTPWRQALSQLLEAVA